METSALSEASAIACASFAIQGQERRSHSDMRHMELVTVSKYGYGMGHGSAGALVADTLHEDGGR
jgi:hypothetical protein